MILADTNVVSEFMRPAIAPAVLAWAEGIAPGGLVISVITVQEIEYGIGLLPEGARRSRLRDTWDSVADRFASAVIDFDRSCALQTARVLVESEQAGRRMTLADAQIAGTCLVHGHTLATRNTKDFLAVRKLSVVDPFRTA